MTIVEMKDEIEQIRLELEKISSTVPSDYEEYNQMRLKYDTAITRIQVLRSQIELTDLEQSLV